MKRITGLIVVLALINALSAFALNIIANQVSDLVGITPYYLPWATFGAIVIATILGIALDFHEDLNRNLLNVNVIKVLTDRVITVFLTSIGIGILVGYICHILIPVGHPFFLYDGSDFYIAPWNYEILALIVGVLSLYILKRLKNNIVLSATCSIGFGISLPIIFFELYPEANTWLAPTVITWCLLFLSAVIVLHTNAMQKVTQFLSAALTFLTKVR